jgi:hypothetical protein
MVELSEPGFRGFYDEQDIKLDYSSKDIPKLINSLTPKLFNFQTF